MRACNNLPQPNPYILVFGGCGRLLHALTPPRSAFLYLQFLARCHPYILLHFYTCIIVSVHALLCMRARGRDACTCAVRSSRVGIGETSRSTPAYSEPWMRRERINVSVHSIYAIVCRSPRQTKDWAFAVYPILLCFNILCPFLLTQCYLLREAYV